SIFQLNSSSRSACLLCPLFGSNSDLSVFRRDSCLLHQQLKFEYFFVGACLLHASCQSLIIPADDFLLRSFPAYLVVYNTVSSHIYAHICRRLVGALAEYTLEDCAKYREDFHISIIVYCSFAIGFQMERIDHIHVVKVGSSCFIGQIHWMFQRNIPDREGLKFGIACMDAPFMLMKIGRAHV